MIKNLAAMNVIQHREPPIKNYIISHVRDIFMNKGKYVILDTETTGLGQNDVIIQIALINLDGKVLFDSLINPTKRKRISGEATAIHGLRMSDLRNAPHFYEVIDKIYELTLNKTVIIYNEDFDRRLIKQTCLHDKIKYLYLDTICGMELNNFFVGQWSEYHKNYRWQKLKGGDHTALGDCLATLRTLEKIGITEFTKNSKGKVEFEIPEQMKNSEIRRHPLDGCLLSFVLIVIALFFLYVCSLFF